MSRRRSLCRGALHCSAGAASGGRLRRAALGAGGQQRRARGPGRQGGCRTKTPSEPRTVAVGAGTSRPSPPNRRWSWAARTVEGSGERQAPASWRGTVFPNLFPCFFFASVQIFNTLNFFKNMLIALRCVSIFNLNVRFILRKRMRIFQHLFPAAVVSG